MIILSLAVRIYLFLDLGAILGADVGRMTTVSHVWFLKGKITEDLRPYDMANGFFYFPGVFLLPLAFEYLGINPIDTVTFFSFLFSFLSTLIFYKIARIFLDKKEAIASYFFYSFAFDIVLIFSLFGIFPFGFSAFFFLVTIWQMLNYYFKKRINIFLLTLGIFGIFMFHWYLLPVLAIFLLSLFTHSFVEGHEFKKPFLIFSFSFCLAFLISFPFWFPFWKWGGISRLPENQVDILSFTVGRLKMNEFDKFRTVFFTSYVGSFFSPLLVIGFFISIPTLLLKKELRFWLYFFIFLSVACFLVFGELNLLRITSFLWLPYSLCLGSVLKNHQLNLLFLLLLFFIPSPSIPFVINALNRARTIEPGEPTIIVPYVDFHKFNKAMDWIRKNTPENSTFLIDGGGAGCTGASASYGERIFPLTSRKVFYFSNYCWANYNRTEYMKRVDLYRRVSINASCCIDELKSYNVTHVFIGEKWVAFDPKYFLNNPNYKLIYDENGYKIFEIV
ncbi:MAG TPA: hypothetical protein ENF38_01845 [Candidatus Aenigmarchaeota archaeon]|nr:hypothetical protein [Candidatus Aenigmarchaeota archaeon]